MAALRAKRFTSALVPFVLSMLRARGKDVTALEKKYLHVRTADGNAMPEVSLDELGGILTDAAKVLGDPLFGLHAAVAMPRGSYGLLEFALRAAPTGRLAMEQLVTYGALINPLVRWSLELDGDDVSLHHRAPKKGGVGREGNVFTVTRVLQIAREMMGDDVVPTQAWFAHDQRAPEPELAKFLGTTHLAFGRASNGLSFSSKTLARTPIGADAELNAALEAHGRALLEQLGDVDDAYEQVRAVVVAGLAKGKASLTHAARALHVTPRTLQRRLDSAGVRFNSLLLEVRRAQAERLLARSEDTIDEVAEQVGYRDTTAFVRAFKGWTGRTPGKFREQNK